MISRTSRKLREIAYGFFPSKLMRFFSGKKFNILGADFEVYPLSLAQAPQFISKLANIVATVGGVNLAMKDGELDVNSKDNQKLLASLIPHLIQSSMDLFYGCVTAKHTIKGGNKDGSDEVVDITDQIKDIPHDAAVPLIESWVDQSFGSIKKLQPWISLVESLMTKIGGEKFNLSELVSRDLSKADTVTKTSVTDTEKDIHTQE